MKHRAVEAFWKLYDSLPKKVRQLADKDYELLKSDPSHTSLNLNEIKTDPWSIRVGRHYGALAYPEQGNFVWFWIGSHAKYDRLIK